MADQDWCLDGSTKLPGDQSIRQEIIDIRNEYTKAFQDFHNDKVSGDEWDNLIESTGVRNLNITSLDKKPSFQELFNWDEKIEASGWSALNLLKDKYPEVKIDLFKDQKQKANDFIEFSRILRDQALFMTELAELSVSREESGNVFNRFLISHNNMQRKYAAGGADINFIINSLYEMNSLVAEMRDTDRARGLPTVAAINLREKSSNFYNVNPNPAEGLKELQKAEDLLLKIKGCPDRDSISNQYFNEIRKISLLEDEALRRERADLENFRIGPNQQKRLDEIKARQAEKANKLEQAIAAVGADEIIFEEQCFLLANLAELVKFKKQLTGSLTLPYAGQDDFSYFAEDTSGASVEIVNDQDIDTFASDQELVVNAGGYNSPIHIQGDSFAFTNKLSVSPYQRALFDLKEHELSILTPHMRFFKVDSDDDGNDISTEFIFDTNVTKDLKNYINRRADQKGGRGLGVGVKSFNFSYDGTDPFSAKKAISAKLSIYAPSFSDLLEERRSPEGRVFRYVDLALKTGRYKSSDKDTEEAIKNADSLNDIERENLDKLNFRLQVLVELASKNTTLRKFSQDKKNAIYESAITLYLTPTIHEFDFDEAGGVTFTINYLAYVEDYFSNLQFDIFGSMTADQKAREMTYDFFRQSGCDLGGIDFAQFKLADELYVSNMNSGALSSILKHLQMRDKIYYTSISKKEIRKWLLNPMDNSYIVKPKTSGETSISETAIDAAVKAAAGAAGTADEKIAKLQYRLSLVTNNDLVENTAFFYLTDLIQAVMYNIEIGLSTSKNILETNYMQKILDGTIKDTEPIQNYIEKRLSNKKDPKVQASRTQFKKLRIVLGPMEITPFGSNSINDKAISCTIGDIPISLTYFLDFMSEKVLSKDFLQYPLSKFIKDFINDCVKNFINADGCFATNASQKVSLNSTTVLAYNDIASGNGEDDLTNLILTEPAFSSDNCLLLNKVSKDRFPILKISGPFGPRKRRSVDKMINYYIFSIGRRYPVDAYTGNVNDDADNGVFHYVLGDSKGIVKSISLDKTNTPGLKELRFEQEGFDGLEQLREVYNANITTFINPQTFPGTYLYVEPRGFDPTTTEDLTRFGIGGYYMITKTSHQITPGNSETSINAAWVASKGGQIIKGDSETDPDKRDVSGTEEDQKKCRVKALQNSVNVRGT